MHVSLHAMSGSQRAGALVLACIHEDGETAGQAARLEQVAPAARGHDAYLSALPPRGRHSWAVLHLVPLVSHKRGHIKETECGIAKASYAACLGEFWVREVRDAVRVAEMQKSNVPAAESCPAH